MAAVYDGEVKTHFFTKEGEYRLVPEAGLRRPSKLPYNPLLTLPVRLSFVTLGRSDGSDDRVVFNVDRELYFYTFCGATEEAGPNQNIDRKSWKVVQPTCHDINPLTRSPVSVDVVVGMSRGLIHVLDPIRGLMLSSFNEARQVDKTNATDVRWVPGSDSFFVAAHQSGCLYVYNRELPTSSHPHFVTSYQGQTYAVLTNKSKGKNPVQKWTVGFGGFADWESPRQRSNSSVSSTSTNCSADYVVCASHAINEIAFSPDCKHLAIGSQDGFMRVFDFDSRRLVGVMRSYFGGVTCVSWSPDGRYVVAGSQDDLVAVWSFEERQLIARGVGHSSFVCRVAFDPYTTSLSCRRPLFPESACNGKVREHLSRDAVKPREETSAGATACDSRQEATSTTCKMAKVTKHTESTDLSSDTSYRFGSVGHDSDLILWDLGGDVLNAHQMSVPCGRSSSGLLTGSSLSESAVATHGQSSASATVLASGDVRSEAVDSNMENSAAGSSPVRTNHVDILAESSVSETSSSTSRSSAGSHGWRRAGTLFRHSKNKSIANSGGGSAGSGEDSGGGKARKKNIDDAKTHLEVVEVPPIFSMGEVPLIPCLVNKKISHERLTDIAFREDCIVTAAQDGVIKCWARPHPVSTPPTSLI